MKYLKYKCLLAIILGCSLSGCFDLTEEVFDRVDSGVYYQDENSVKSAVATIYSTGATSYAEYFWYRHLIDLLQKIHNTFTIWDIHHAHFQIGFISFQSCRMTVLQRPSGKRDTLQCKTRDIVTKHLLYSQKETGTSEYTT